MVKIYQFIFLTISLVVCHKSTKSYNAIYCSQRYGRLCQGKGQHVACQYPFSGPGEYCANYSQIYFDDELIHFVKHYINSRRQNIAMGQETVSGSVFVPKPELMMMVEWDDELASLAQILADQCLFLHDECRATARYPYAGQSVSEVKWKGASDLRAEDVMAAVKKVFDAWWSEKDKADVTALVEPFSLDKKKTIWGHFSQLAIWSLRAIGCGAVRHGRDYVRLLLVCDFSHTNMLGRSTLKPGPLANCPRDTARQSTAYPLLCSSHKKVWLPKFQNSLDSYVQYDDVRVRENEEEMNVTNSRSEGREGSKEDNLDSKQMKNEEPESYIAMYDYILPAEKEKGAHGRTNADSANPDSDEAYSLYSDVGTAKSKHRMYSQTYTTENPILMYDYILPMRKVKFQSPSRKGLKTTVDSYETTVDDQEDVDVPLRHTRKWFRGRTRTRRPGLDRMLSVTVKKKLAYNQKKVSKLSMVSDKEILEQLYRDTGFSVGKTKPRAWP